MNTNAQRKSFQLDFNTMRFWEPGSTGIILALLPTASAGSEQVSRLAFNQQQEICSTFNLRFPTLSEIFNGAVKDQKLREAITDNPVRILGIGSALPKPRNVTHGDHSVPDSDLLYTLDEHGTLVKAQSDSNPEKTICIGRGYGQLAFSILSDSGMEKSKAAYRYSVFAGWDNKNLNDVSAFVRNYVGPISPGEIMDSISMDKQNPVGSAFQDLLRKYK